MMKKLVIIGQVLNKNHATNIVGGIQSVERLHVKIFLSAGWDVYFIAPSCSEEFVQDPHFHLCRCSVSAKDQTGVIESGEALTKAEFYKLRAEKSKHSKILSADIESWIHEIQPNLIINHSFTASQISVTAKFAVKIPALCFIHNTPDTAMDIGIFSKVKSYLKLTQVGGALICMSDYQRDLWRQVLKKRKNSGGETAARLSFITESEIDLIYDKFCYPIFVEKQEVQNPDKYFIVISRPDPIKNVSKLLELSKGLNYHLHLFLAHPGDLAGSEYYREKILPYLNANITVHHNSPRQDLLDCLAHASGCFIPCTVEAAPVALLEAGSYGVPSIVFAKERSGVLDHAACYLLERSNLTLVNVSEKSDVAAAQLKIAIENPPPIDRYDLRDLTCQRHSFQKRSDELLAITTDVMSNYTKVVKPLLEFA